MTKSVALFHICRLAIGVWLAPMICCHAFAQEPAIDWTAQEVKARRELALSLSGSDAGKIALAWNKLAGALFELARLEEAILAFESAVRYAPKDPIHWANLADAHRLARQPAKALQAYRELLGDLDFASAGGGASLRESLNLGALLARDRGDFVLARSLLLKRLSLQTGGAGDAAESFRTLHALAAIALDMDDPEGARDYAQKALAIDSGDASTRARIASIMVKLEPRSEGAVERLSDLLSALLIEPEPDWRMIVAIYHDLAGSFFQMNDTQRFRIYAGRAYQTSASKLGPNDRITTRSAVTYAVALNRQGEHDAARRLLSTAVEQEDSPLYLRFNALQTWAAIEAQEEKFGAALELSARADELAKMMNLSGDNLHKQLMVDRGIVFEKLDLRTDAFASFAAALENIWTQRLSGRDSKDGFTLGATSDEVVADLVLSYLAEQVAPSPELTLKALQLRDETAASKALRAASIRLGTEGVSFAGELRVLHELRSRQKVRSAQIASLLDADMGFVELNEQYRETLAEIEAVLDRLPASLSMVDGGLVGRTLHTELYSLLRREEALLAFAHVEPNSRLSGGLYGVVVRVDGMVVTKVGILNSAGLQSDTAALRASVAPLSRGQAPLPFDLAAAHALYRDLIAPLEPHLKGVKRLLVVPDGPLQSLPLEALVTAPPAGGAFGPDAYRKAQWLGDRYEIAVLPSVSALRACPKSI